MLTRLVILFIRRHTRLPAILPWALPRIKYASESCFLYHYLMQRASGNFGLKFFNKVV